MLKSERINDNDGRQEIPGFAEKNEEEIRAEEVNFLKKGIGSLRNFLDEMKGRLIDISPDFFISADKLIEEFRKKREQSGNVCQDAGKFFDYLAQNTIVKPSKKYSGSARKSYLTEKTNYDILALKKLKEQFEKKRDQIKAVDLAIKQLSTQGRSDFFEQEIDGKIFQYLSKSYEQEGDVNIIEENVYNSLGTEFSKSYADIIVHNQATEHSIDLSLLLPEGYHFCPADMESFQKTSTDKFSEDEEGLIFGPRDLKSYSGSNHQTNDDFLVKVLITKILYGNLSKKGGLLSLLHEIAHAWQTAYDKPSGRFDFEDNMKEVFSRLEVVAKMLHQLDEMDRPMPEELKNFFKELISSLKQYGVYFDPYDPLTHDNELKGNQFRLADNAKDEDGDRVKIVFRSDKLRSLIKEYVREEREVWAHAIRVLRFFRKQGIDLEPELKTLEDIQRHVHTCLGTYQESLESILEIPKDIKKFSIKNEYMKTENSLRPFDPEKMVPLNHTVYGHADDPDRVIREVEMYKKDPQIIMERIKRSKALLEELEKNYHLPMPQTEYVIGENDFDSKSIYMVTQKVDGENLGQGMQINEQEKAFLAAKSEKIICALADYLITKLRAGETFMDDIYRAEQYKFGTLPGSSEKDVYLIDLEPREAINYGKAGKEADYHTNLSVCVPELIDFIQDIGQATGIEMPQARQKVSELIAYYKEIGIDIHPEDIDKVEKFIHASKSDKT